MSFHHPQIARLMCYLRGHKFVQKWIQTCVANTELHVYTKARQRKKNS